MILKKKALAGAAAVVALATFSMTGSAIAQIPTLPPPPGAAHVGGKPRIQAALKHLNAALQSLTNAKPDEDGHRDKAISFVNQAIAECQTCLNEK
jgi:hypothetical protein